MVRTPCAALPYTERYIEPPPPTMAAQATARWKGRKVLRRGNSPAEVLGELVASQLILS